MNEVEEILEMIQSEEFREVMISLFGQVARCIGSPHFQVTHKAGGGIRYQIRVKEWRVAVRLRRE